LDFQNTTFEQLKIPAETCLGLSLYSAHCNCVRNF